MCELWNELNKRFEQADKDYRWRLKRQELSGDPIPERSIKRLRDLKVCIDALAKIDGDLVDVSVSDSVGGEDNPTPPQRELRRQKDPKE